ncbi:YncE family protein [Flavobacterium cellulosilyticum]|uniref:YncE family protein n=1 Tax=Flavobacterium cellulosilyticum TaxID=2541731 RepID=A0A4V2YZ89_9FLAO|nr:YncE family protein [Flavobacterium cellulosilyticum]TDD96147.1 YncE family protein [Flavobacterium cellulosilyticum]
MKTKTLTLTFGLLLIVVISIKAQTTDVIYTTDQNSNTVTVIDGDKQEILGTLVLGYPNTDSRVFSPLYNGDINVHGINHDPVHQKVAVVSTVSNSVTIIDANTAKIIGRTNVGRNPHEPRFTKDGHEIWVTVRGDNYVSVLDAKSLKEKQRIILSEGPGMISFSNDGKKAFVCSSFDDNFWVIDVKTKKIIKTIKVPSKFSPFVNTTPDGKEVWVTHKDVGMVSRIDAINNTLIESFETGKITNHIGFSPNKYFVTVGGENKVKVYEIGSDNKAKMVNEIKTNDLPHGIWESTDGTKQYIVNELADSFQIIDVKNMEIVNTLPIGMRPQALIVTPFKGNLEVLKNNIKNQNPEFKGPKN